MTRKDNQFRCGMGVMGRETQRTPLPPAPRNALTEVNEHFRTGVSTTGALLRTLPWQKGRWGDRRRGTAFASKNEALLKVNTGRRVGGWCGEEC